MKANASKKSIVGSMFWSAFLTCAIMEASNTGAGLIDGIIMARMLGADAVAAQGIAQPIFSITGIFAGLLSVGTQAICSSELARGNIEESQHTFSASMIVGLILSAIITIFLYLKAETFATLLGARGNAAELMPLTTDYLRGIAIGILPMMVSYIIAVALQIDSAGNLVRIGSITLAVVDIVVDIIFAKLGYGLFGIGLGTSISYIIYFLILMIHFLKKNNLFTLNFKKPNFKCLGKVALLGSEKASKRAMNTIRPIILNAIIIAAGGAMGMSALSIRNNVNDFLSIITVGIAGAVGLLTGIFYGEKNKQECKDVGHKAHRYIFIFSVVSALILIFFSKQLTKIYVSEEGELFNLVRFAFISLAVSTPFSTFVSTRTSYLQSTRQITKVQLINLISKLFVIVVAALICVNIWGSYGVILSFVFSDIIVCIVIYIFTSGKAKTPRPNVDEYMSLPEDFNLKPYDVIELNVKNEEEAVTVAEQLQLFCKGHKVDTTKGYKAALCLEEIVVNIIRHGYPKSKQKDPIDIRVTISNGDIIMKVRDTCPRFDLPQRIKLVQDQANSEKNVGIKMINKTAKNIKYVNIMNTNTLIITV